MLIAVLIASSCSPVDSCRLGILGGEMPAKEDMGITPYFLGGGRTRLSLPSEKRRRYGPGDRGMSRGSVGDRNGVVVDDDDDSVQHPWLMSKSRKFVIDEDGFMVEKSVRYLWFCF